VIETLNRFDVDFENEKLFDYHFQLEMIQDMMTEEEEKEKEQEERERDERIQKRGIRESERKRDEIIQENTERERRIEREIQGKTEETKETFLIILYNMNNVQEIIFHNISKN